MLSSKGRQGRACLSLCCAAHLAVDFACALLVWGLLAEASALHFLFYNFCAFALQMPLGKGQVAVCLYTIYRRGLPAKSVSWQAIHTTIKFPFENCFSWIDGFWQTAHISMNFYLTVTLTILLAFP